jgi:hypothetical protein
MTAHVEHFLMFSGGGKSGYCTGPAADSGIIPDDTAPEKERARQRRNRNHTLMERKREEEKGVDVRWPT